jgi:hypothetical protein
VIENNDWDFGEIQLARSEQAAVASDDARVCIDQNRVRKSELGDARGNLCDLRIRMVRGLRA